MNDQQDHTKTKNIIFKGIDFKIIDVPQHVLTILNKNIDLTSDFSIEKASTYIKMILHIGQIPEDFQNRLVIASCDKNTKPSESLISDSKSVLFNLLLDYNPSDIEIAFNKNKKKLNFL